MKSFFLLPFSFCLVLSCAAPYQVQTKTDRFTGVKSVSEQNNGVAYGGNVLLDIEPREFYFNLTGLQTPGLPMSYYLSFQYVGDDWLFIAESTPLRFLADGRRIDIYAALPPRRSVLKVGKVLEQIPYALTRDILRQLVQAQKLEVKIQHIDFTIPPLMQSRWQKFLAEYWPEE